MKKSEFKNRIISICLRQLEDNLKTAKGEMNEAQQAANEAGPPKDRYDPFRSQMLRRRNLFAEQCQSIVNDLELIKKINPETVSNTVSFGSVVITTGHKLFLAVSLGKIEIEKEIYFVASIHTPLFEAMKDKKIGDSFEINKMKFKILDIF